MVSLWPNDNKRKIKGFKLVVYEIPSGNIAAYFLEVNPLVASGKSGDLSNMPTPKSISVIIEKTDIMQPII